MQENKQAGSHRNFAISGHRLSKWVIRKSNNDNLRRFGIPREEIRNFQVVDGPLIFLFGGRGISSNGKPIVIFIFFAIIIPLGLYFGFVAPWLWHHVSPSVPIVFAYLSLICLTSFFRAALSDPGILPRAVHLLDDNKIMPSEYSLGVGVPGKLPNNPIYLKYCSTCRIWRPPRASHCSSCDRCIDLHDHHCVYLNNCVGRRNYKYFLSFIVSTVASCFYMSATCFYHLIKRWKLSENHISFASSARDTPVSLLLAIYTILASIFPTLLLLFHILLGFTGRTTHEYLRTSRKAKRPFASNNLFSNFFECLCRPKGTDLFLPREHYLEGDMRFEKMSQMEIAEE